jgi:hypothetical protein
MPWLAGTGLQVDMSRKGDLTISPSQGPGNAVLTETIDQPDQRSVNAFRLYVQGTSANDRRIDTYLLSRVAIQRDILA